MIRKLGARVCRIPREGRHLTLTLPEGETSIGLVVELRDSLGRNRMVSLSLLHPLSSHSQPARGREAPVEGEGGASTWYSKEGVRR